MVEHPLDSYVTYNKYPSNGLEDHNAHILDTHDAYP